MCQDQRLLQPAAGRTLHAVELLQFALLLLLLITPVENIIGAVSKFPYMLSCADTDLVS